MTKPAEIRSIQEFQTVLSQKGAFRHTHIRLYRGQREAKDLLPSLFRKFKDRVDLIHEKEARMLECLKERIPRRTPSRPKNDWDWLSFGQHYRLPTRLLDWSKEPLVALYFAVESPPISPTVYIYHAQRAQIVGPMAKRDSLANIKKTRIMIPSVHSVRVALQAGWHTVHRIHPTGTGSKTVIPLGDMRWHEGRIETVTIDPTRVETIREELERMGIYSATIYGNFEDICDSICRDCDVEP
jgi:FRG domain